MGACYSVELKLKFKNGEADKEKAVKALQNYIRIHNGDDVNFCLEDWKKDGVTQDTFEDLLRIFFCGWSRWNMGIEQNGEWLECDNDFDASYGWEEIMLDAFETISPFLSDGSEIYVYPDSDCHHAVIDNGKCIDVQYADL